MIRIAFIIFSMILLCSVATAQQITSYQMYSSIPQSNQVNPVFAPNAKVTIGLPLISSDYISINAPVSWDDFFMRDTDDSLVLNSNRLIEAFEGTDGKLDFQGNIGLLYFGLDTKVGFFTLNFNSRVDLGFTMPGNIIQFILRGSENPSEPSVLRIKETDLRASWFNELALGFRRQINDELAIGVKIKYLQGLANISVEGLNGQLVTSIDSIHISMDPWVFNTAGIDSLQNGSRDYFLFKNNNNGWGIDLGAEYKLTDNILLTASILDLGKITWRDDTKSYLFSEVNYTFEGVDLLDLLDDNEGTGSDNEDLFQDELDSLKDLFNPEEVEGEVYSTPLTGKFYLGGNYTLMDMHTFGLVIYGQVFKSNLTPAVGLTYNIKVGKVLTAGVNATYRNESFNNFGLAVALRLGPANLYAGVDNFQSILVPNTARSISIRVGLNLMFGKSLRN